MTRIRLLALALPLSGFLWVCPQAAAQQVGQPPPGVAPAYPAPPAAPAEYCPAAPCEAPTTKVCVAEPKTNTRIVYTSRCQEYCLPRCWCLLDLIRGGGSCDCGEDGNCGPVRTRHVLVKKKVPDCDTVTCVVKEVPCGGGGPSPCPPAVVMVPAPSPQAGPPAQRPPGR
jgi:hypothetical protein